MDLLRASNATEVPVNAQNPGHDAPSTPSVSKTAEEWKATLTPEQYAVLREHGTEPRGTSPLNKEKRDGMFRCAGCGQELFAPAPSSRAAPAGRASTRRCRVR